MEKQKLLLQKIRFIKISIRIPVKELIDNERNVKLPSLPNSEGIEPDRSCIDQY